MPESASSIVRSPADLLSAIPFVMGYHPGNCMVAVFVSRTGRITCGLSISREAPATFIVEQCVEAASRADAGWVYLVGYLPLADRATVDEVAEKLKRAVPICGCLVVNEGRYYCADPQCPCTPQEGIAFDTSSTVIAAEMTFRGRVALPSRQHIDEVVAADPAAQARTAAYLTDVPTAPTDPVTVVHSCMAIARSGGMLTDVQAAELAVALRDGDGRSAAWRATTDQRWQRSLWLDLTRRVPDEYVATPANLLAWNAWRCDEPVLAWTAVVKATRAWPGNTMSNLIATVLSAPINPANLPWPLPEGFDPQHLFG